MNLLRVETAKVFRPLLEPSRYKAGGAVEAQARVTSWVRLSLSAALCSGAHWPSASVRSKGR